MAKRGVVLAGLAIVVAALGLAWVVLSDGDGDADNPVVAPRTTTTAIGSSTTTALAVPDEAAVIWPAPGQGGFVTPDEAAASFAEDFLGFTDPLMGPFEATADGTGEASLRPAPSGPSTVIELKRLADGRWGVTGATTDDIQLTEPAPLATVVSPVRLRGRALAFEGNVSVEVRHDAGRGAIGSGFVTGGGDVPRPFEGDIAFETPGSPHGALVLFTESAEDGRRWQAVAVRVTFRSTDVDAARCGAYEPARPRPGPDEMEVKAYFTCGVTERPVPVYRVVPKSRRVLEAALRVLLAGPSDVEREGPLTSWFSAETADMLRSVRVTDGHAVVDLADLRKVIPNASTSAGSARLLAELDATVFQFPTVASVEYRIDGSCEDFNEWLQYGGCERRTRPDSQD